MVAEEAITGQGLRQLRRLVRSAANVGDRLSIRPVMPCSRWTPILR